MFQWFNWFFFSLWKTLLLMKLIKFQTRLVELWMAPIHGTRGYSSRFSLQLLAFTFIYSRSSAVNCSRGCYFWQYFVFNPTYSWLNCLESLMSVQVMLSQTSQLFIAICFPLSIQIKCYARQIYICLIN